MVRIFTLLLLLTCLSGYAQTLPQARSVDWTLAGLKDTTTVGFVEIDMGAEGAIGDGQTPNDSILNSILFPLSNARVILNFPAGNFLFNETISLTSNVVIKGAGAEETTFSMDLGGVGHAISIRGIRTAFDTTSLVSISTKGSTLLEVADMSLFAPGDWLHIIQNDTDLVTSTWAKNTVGQVAQVQSVSNNMIELESPVRMDYDTDRSPYVLKIIPVQNIGVECLKIHRIDDTAPRQTSNLYFAYAVNCWVNGVESENCTFSHVQANRSSNLSISKSYFHHAFDYGGGGRAYGVMLQSTSNECLVENNVFERLRHAMIVQSGANGNVFAYNYSFDPFWDLSPSDAAGDMVLHGNYPYVNLFEQNICQNIVIDNSHGPNGPHNTIFRNRSKGFGIFFSADNSPNQNLIGNEVTNINSPYLFLNYTISGSGHFIHGNNNKGMIHPTGTDSLPDISYAYNTKPQFISENEWSGIGTPNVVGAFTIPAFERNEAGAIFSDACGNAPLVVSTSQEAYGAQKDVKVYPNPLGAELTIESAVLIQEVTVLNSIGQKVYSGAPLVGTLSIPAARWAQGVHFVHVQLANGERLTQVVVKR